MQKFWVTTLISIILFVFSLSSAVAQEVKGPKMVIEKSAYDFKKVKEGEVLEHTFRVLNQGDQDLEIKRVKPG